MFPHLALKLQSIFKRSLFWEHTDGAMLPTLSSLFSIMD